MSGPRHLDRAELARAIAACSIHAPHVTPLFQAAYHHVICISAPSRDGTIPERLLARSRLPSIVLVGDDCADGTDTGPGAWRATRHMVRWARHAVINAAGGKAEDYRAAVFLAVQVRRLVLVECGTAHFQAWHDLFAQAGLPTVNLIPSDGLHPVPRARAGLH